MELDLIYYVILFFTGVFAGFVDAISGGGGLITIPALLACGVPAHLALATNKLQGCFGTITTSYVYLKHIKLDNIISGIVYTTIGAIGGVIAVLLIQQEKINYIVLLCLVLIFLYMIFKPSIGEVSGQKRMSTKSFYVLFGLVLGFYDGFIGAGAGSFWTFAFVMVLGLDMKEANMNTKILNFTSNFISLLAFAFLYKIMWVLGCVMGLGQIFGSILGARFALKTNPRVIKTVFLVMVFLTILKLGYSLDWSMVLKLFHF